MSVAVYHVWMEGAVSMVSMDMNASVLLDLLALCVKQVSYLEY